MGREFEHTPANWISIFLDQRLTCDKGIMSFVWAVIMSVVYSLYECTYNGGVIYRIKNDNITTFGQSIIHHC